MKHSFLLCMMHAARGAGAATGSGRATILRLVVILFEGGEEDARGAGWPGRPR